jgi:Ca2+-binding EF-hand superfamily protein
MLDIDNSGNLSIEELKRAFEAGGNKKTEKFWKTFILDIDKNGDSEISLEEFQVAMTKILEIK